MDKEKTKHQDKKKPEPTEQKQPECLEDKAAEAVSQPIADEQKLNLSDMPTEIAQMIADRVPDAQFPNEKKPTEQLNPLSQLALTSRLFHDAIYPERMINALVLKTAHGQQDQIEKLFLISPRRILDLTAQRNLKDYSNRQFKGKNKISAWKYAIWANDWHMYTMMLKAVNNAAARAIPAAEFADKTPDDIAKLRQTRPYVGRLTEKEVKNLWKELLEQYQEVTEQGLNYTIDYNEITILLKANSHYLRRYKACIQTACTVEVTGETHFDLKGPELCVMQQDEEFPMEKGKIYVYIENNTILHYRLIGLDGHDVADKVSLEDFKRALTNIGVTPDLESNSFEDITVDLLTGSLGRITYCALIKITSERKHTHPQALISALNTYIQQAYHWSEHVMDRYWRFVYGMAERLLPACVAHQICEPIKFNQDKNFHNPLNRSLRISQIPLPDGNYQHWFPINPSNDLGIKFAIYNEPNAWCPYPNTIRPWNFMRPSLEANLAALSALNETRARDIEILGEQLLASVQKLPELAESTLKQPKTT